MRAPFPFDQTTLSLQRTWPPHSRPHPKWTATPIQWSLTVIWCWSGFQSWS